MIEEKILLKLIDILLKPLDESILVLKRIEAKLDAQAHSDLKGALNSLQDAILTSPKDKSIIRTILVSLAKSSVYYKSLLDQSKISIEDLKKNMEDPFTIKGFKALGITPLSFFTKFYTEPLKNLYTSYLEFANLVNIYQISEIGRIVCMIELKYKINLMKKIYSTLKTLTDEEDQIIVLLICTLAAFVGYTKNWITVEVSLLDKSKLIRQWKSFSFMEKLSIRAIMPFKEDFINSLFRVTYQFLTLRNIIESSKSIEVLIKETSKGEILKV